MPNSSLAYATPTQLLEYGVAANAGTVMLERGWISCKDQETKNYLLRVKWGLDASKALPRPGDQPKWNNAASQLLIGMMLGQDRSTTNRNLRMFCGEDAKVAYLFHKWRPGIGCVNRYRVREKPGTAPANKKTVFKMHDPERLAELYGHEHFDAEMEGASGAGPVALWTYDENIPRPLRCVCRKGQMKLNFSSRCMKCGGKGFTLDPRRKMGPNPRTVLSVLQLKGIAKFGVLEITSAKLGELAGLCENTVADALDQCEDLKILQIVPGRVLRDRAGAVVGRLPQRIIWLPGLLMDHAILERERARFAMHLAETRERALLNGWACAGVHLARIAALHQEQLSRWLLSRHSLGAFWNAMRKLIHVEKLTPDALNQRTKRWESYADYLFPLHLE
jgi:hypothetical protein